MYTAQKLCNFAGQTFRVGEVVPNELIHVTAIPRLIKSGVIAETGTGELLSGAGSIESQIEIEIPVFKDDQTIMAKLDEEEITVWATVLQKNATEAATIIDDITDSDLLMVIHATDSRKGVKTVVEARVATISEVTPEE